MTDSNVRWLENQHTPLPKISNNSLGSLFARWLIIEQFICRIMFKGATAFR